MWLTFVFIAKIERPYSFSTLFAFAVAEATIWNFADDVVKDQTAQNVQSDLKLHRPPF